MFHCPARVAGEALAALGSADPLQRTAHSLVSYTALQVVAVAPSRTRHAAAGEGRDDGANGGDCRGCDCSRGAARGVVVIALVVREQYFIVTICDSGGNGSDSASTYKTLQAAPSYSAILFGPPGTAKTTVAPPRPIVPSAPSARPKQPRPRAPATHPSFRLPPCPRS